MSAQPINLFGRASFSSSPFTRVKAAATEHGQLKMASVKLVMPEKISVWRPLLV